MISNTKDRELFERIFGKILFVENYIEEEFCSNFGNIMSYPDYFQSKSIDNAIQQSNSSNAIVKVWKN
jgi:hypothetical protein